MLSLSLRALAFVFFLFQLLCAWLQVNDPDPLIWTSYYLLCAAVPLLVVFKRFYAPLFWVALTLSALVVAIYIPGTLEYLRHMNQEPLMQSMNPEKPYIEETRELIGGALALVMVGASRWLHRWSQ